MTSEVAFVLPLDVEPERIWLEKRMRELTRVIYKYSEHDYSYIPPGENLTEVRTRHLQLIHKWTLELENVSYRLINISTDADS